MPMRILHLFDQRGTVLFRGTPPRDAVQELLARDPREEA